MGKQMTESKRFPIMIVRFLAVWATVMMTVFLPLSFSATLEELDQNIGERETAFYREFFDRIFYEPFAQLLRFDRIAERLTFRKYEALDINPFDEVPDSGFFANRNGRDPLSLADLKRGPEKGSGPNPGGPWRVIKGKLEGVSTGLFIEDQAGERYLLKFDPKDNPEMATSAEIISHKFFHAFGYHVAEYYLVRFNPDILTLDPKATYYNEDGFKKRLTQEALAELLERVPKFKGGVVRASASKLLAGSKGYMDFEGRRKSDPADLIPHEDRRSIRALRVFGSWLNHYDLREGNTLDRVEVEDGKAFLKHYLIDFGSTLGSAADHPKVPVAGYEYIVDWYEVGKAAPTLKIVEKPWEKKWDELNRQIAYPALGYFDNSQFDPEEWKTQMPYEVFDRLTLGDAFWATKILMAFSDEEIRSVVETAEFSDPENARILSEILIARRDIVGQYWFSRVTPLDRVRLFDMEDGTYQVRFSDLRVQYGFAQSGNVRYRYRLVAPGQEGKYQESEAPSISFRAPSLDAGSRAILFIQAKYGTKDAWSDPPLKITLVRTTQEASLEIAQIDHGA